MIHLTPAGDLHDSDAHYMRHALLLAARGEGHVEPNPMVGCVVVRDGKVVGSGWHQQYGGPHAEVHALAAAGELARGATLYVTLEPCCHTGKTPPCTNAILQAGISRVVVALEDPYAEVAGGGLTQLRKAGIPCDVGIATHEASDLLAPYLQRLATGRPWVIAKWAMTLDGKLATRDGSSQWISGPASRAKVHHLRGRMDAIIVGAGTVRADDPLLTARPAGPRTPMRIVVGNLPRDSQLARTLAEGPVMVAHHAGERSQYDWLGKAGGQFLPLESADPVEQIAELLAQLGSYPMTNVLVEGGGRLLGSFFDAGLIDEVHAMVAPKLVGGSGATSPIGGTGLPLMPQALLLRNPQIEILDSDVYMHGRIDRAASLRGSSLPG